MSYLLETDGVGFDVAKDPVEIVFVDAKELAAILSGDDGRRPAHTHTTVQLLSLPSFAPSPEVTCPVDGNGQPRRKRRIRKRKRKDEWTRSSA